MTDSLLVDGQDSLRLTCLLAYLIRRALVTREADRAPRLGGVCPNRNGKACMTRGAASMVMLALLYTLLRCFLTSREPSRVFCCRSTIVKIIKIHAWFPKGPIREGPCIHNASNNFNLTITPTLIPRKVVGTGKGQTTGNIQTMYY